MIWTLVGGFLSLALLDAAVSSPGSGSGTVASNNLGGVFGVLQKGVNWLVSPTVPGVPNLAGKNSGSNSSMPAPQAPSLVPNAKGQLVVPQNPITAPPPGATGPVRDYAPTPSGGGV